MQEDNKPPIRDPRIANLDVVQICVEGSEEFRYEQIDNFSRSGVYVRTDNPYPLSSRVNMVFTLVTEPKQGKSKGPNILPVNVKGEVVRLVETEEAGITGPGMGIKFIGLDAKATRLIDEIVNQRLETTPTVV